MSVPNRNDRRSVFIDYASAHYYPSQYVDSLAMTRARSLTRDASMARIHKLENVDCAFYHHRMRSIEKDLNVIDLNRLEYNGFDSFVKCIETFIFICRKAPTN